MLPKYLGKRFGIGQFVGPRLKIFGLDRSELSPISVSAQKMNGRLLSVLAAVFPAAALH